MDYSAVETNKEFAAENDFLSPLVLLVILIVIPQSRHILPANALFTIQRSEALPIV